MFVIETESGDVRLESVEEARTYLEGCLPGAELTVRGLGRLVFQARKPYRQRGRGRTVIWPDSLRVTFYSVYPTLGRQDLILEDILAMLPAMEDSYPRAEVTGQDGSALEKGTRIHDALEKGFAAQLMGEPVRAHPEWTGERCLECPPSCGVCDFRGHCPTHCEPE
ncbi:MAG: hypothetical protein KAT70_08105 [Thermoplasmata archaeon]|nr:hypothetical protein [Thermoplasmata archaeon]